MKCHDWIFLLFTTIICCTATISMAQAQQRGRVRFSMPLQSDETDLNASSEAAPRPSRTRPSTAPRASNRFRSTEQPSLPSPTPENMENPRNPQRNGRRRSESSSSKKLDVEATDLAPQFRPRKRIHPSPAPDQPTKVEIPTASIERTNVIRRGRTRVDVTSTTISTSTSTSTTIAPTSSPSAPYFRRKVDVPTDEVTQSTRKARNFPSRAVTRRSDEGVSSEVPYTITTNKNDRRRDASKRGSAKARISERLTTLSDDDEDQLEDENYPEHFKVLLKKQHTKTVTSKSPRRYQAEESILARSNEIFDAGNGQSLERPRRLQTSQENSDEILQVSRAIPKVRRVELKREDTARAALKSTRTDPPAEVVTPQARVENVTRSAMKFRSQNSRRNEPVSEEVTPQSRAPFKSRREGNRPADVKPNEIPEPIKRVKPLFIPRRAEPYRPKPASTTARSVSSEKPSRKPDSLTVRAKYRPRVNARLPFPALKPKTATKPEEVFKDDNEIGNNKPIVEPVRPLQITKSVNLPLDRPVIDIKSKPKAQKFSSRYRGDAYSRYQPKTEQSKPAYIPTIPAVTTEPVSQQSNKAPSRIGKSVNMRDPQEHDLNPPEHNYSGVVFDEKAGVWNMVEPIAGGLTRSEIIVDSNEEPPRQSAVTVSIFEALADILSKTPTTTSTTSTSTTTTSTTSTTTSTTELPEIIQVPEIKIDSMPIPSTTVNTHLITDVADEYTSTTTNEITNSDRNGRIINSVDINPPPSTTPNPTESPETTTVPRPLSLDPIHSLSPLKSQTEQTTQVFDLTTLALVSAPATQPTNSFELTTLPSNPPTSLPMPHLADALTTPGSSLVTRPQLISAINNFLDTSVQNASDTMATTTTSATDTATTTTLDTDTDQVVHTTLSDASTTLPPPSTTPFAPPPTTDAPPVTISFLDLFTIQPKKVNQNTEPDLEVHPIYREPDSDTTPSPRTPTTDRPVNIRTFLGTQSYPSITITGGTSTDHMAELTTIFEDAVTSGATTQTVSPPTTTILSVTSETTTPSARTQSLPIHLNSILGSTQKYDLSSPAKTTPSESTTTPRSRFGNNRLPILSAGFTQKRNSTTTSTTSTTTSTTTTTTTTRVPPEQSSTTLPLPKQPIIDFSVYGILPNNTVVRKRPPQLSRALDLGIMVYGILPNQTVVRKYPNGTLTIVDSSQDVEVIDIDPKMLFNPFSELYRTSQSSLLLTTHRSTTSHRLIDSNHILNPGSSTQLPNTQIGHGHGRGRGNSNSNSITQTTDASAATTNGDDVNLIQLLTEKGDNLLNSTRLVESNTENAVLLDLLKRKYIKSDLPLRSSNVVSLTTVRNMVEESSIPANRDKDASSNTSVEKTNDTSSSTSSEEDLLGKLFPPTNNVAAAPPPVSNTPNRDDDNTISHHFDNQANVELGGIYAGNKEPKRIENRPTSTVFVVTPGSTTPTTTSTTTTTTTTTPPTTPTTTTTTTTPSTTTTTTMPSTTTSSTTTTTTTTTTTPEPTTVSTTPSTTSTSPTTTVSLQTSSQSNPALASANSELERNIKLLEQLLALQASLKTTSSSTSSSTTTTTTTSTTTPPPPPPISSENKPKTPITSDVDDINFLNTLRQILQTQQQGGKKPATATITTTTTTTPKTTTSTLASTRKPSLEELLKNLPTNSFTTSKPPENDIEFLNSLRDIGKIRVTTATPPTFANRIIELALQNRGVTPTQPLAPQTTTPAFAPIPPIRRPTVLPADELERHRQDQAALSADLSLLSNLLGRRVSLTDLPQLTRQFGGNRRPAAVPRVTTTPRTTTTTTTEKPMTRDEIAEIEKNLNLLSSLLGRPVSLNELPLIMQDLKSGRKPKGTSSGARINLISQVPPKTTTNRPRSTLSAQSQTPISQEEVIELLKDQTVATSPDELNIYGKTNDAILAAVLKQRGIGPTNNNVPINELFLQGPTSKPYRPTRPPPPPPPPSPPQRRPLLDGLAWLWRTWQETAPTPRSNRQNRQQNVAAASTRLESPLEIGASINAAPAPAPVQVPPAPSSAEGGEYADLQYPQNPSFGQGNVLLTAAFGVTRAVTQFLGAAFQGAAKSVQSAFSPQAIQQNSLAGLSG